MEVTNEYYNDGFKHITIEEYIKEMTEYAIEDNFAFIRLFDKLQDYMKNKILNDANTTKTTKTKCECGSMISHRHHKRHVKGRKHLKFVIQREGRKGKGRMHWEFI